jgi:hypothetical protein
MGRHHRVGYLFPVSGFLIPDSRFRLPVLLASAAARCSNIGMLGQVRRTTRADVGMSIAFVGVAYLIWALTIGVIRHSASKLPAVIFSGHSETSIVVTSFLASSVSGALIWDVCGVMWLLISLVLVAGASRQKWSVSWAWFSTLLQAMTCVLLGLWAVLALLAIRTAAGSPAAAPSVGWASFSIAFAFALVLWATVLVWLLTEQARLRRGPSLRDGLRTHVGT